MNKFQTILILVHTFTGVFDFKGQLQQLLKMIESGTEQANFEFETRNLKGIWGNSRRPELKTSV